MNGFNVAKSIEAQEKYCKDNHLPHFAPHSGVCWACGQNIFDPLERHGYLDRDKKWTTGITTKEAGEKLITGCPHCSRTYCD